MNENKIGFYLIAFFFIIACSFSFPCQGVAADNAHYKLPSSSACYVDPSEMPKFLAPKKGTNRHGIERGITEGFIIRGSYVKDGKIVIPKGGLMYFSAGAAYYGHLNGEPTIIAGRTATSIDQQEAMVVKKNFFVPYKKRPIPLAEEGTIAMTQSYYNDRYYGVLRGSFKYVFANGDAAWERRIVLAQDGLGKSQADIASGYLKDEGMISPPPLQYFGDPYSACSSYYLVVDKMTPKGAQIREAGAPDIIWFTTTYDKPILANDMDVGQSLKVGDYQVKVLSIDPVKGTVKVSVLDAAGSTLSEKLLGPLTLETYKVKNFIHHSMKTRRSLALDYENLRIQLNTKYDSAFNPGSQSLINENGELIPVPQANEVFTFHGNRVDLVIYTNVEKMLMRRPWKEDPRFIFITNYI